MIKRADINKMYPLHNPDKIAAYLFLLIGSCICNSNMKQSAAFDYTRLRGDNNCLRAAPLYIYLPVYISRYPFLLPGKVPPLLVHSFFKNFQLFIF
jgi:hypothetical protein